MEDNNSVLKTEITWDELENALQSALGTKAKMGLRKEAQIIGAGQGFQSTIGRIYPCWTKSESDLPESFVVKIPSLKRMENDVNMKKLLTTDGKRYEETSISREENLFKVHNSEVNFYKVISGRGFKTAKTYVLREQQPNHHGIIVMEDLSNAHIIPTYENLTTDEVEQVIEAIAEIHAFSLKNDSWKKYAKTTLRELCTMQNGLNAILLVCRSVAVLGEEIFNPLLAKLETIFQEVFDFDTYENLHLRMGLPPVLSHGDLWSNNLMWTVDGSKRKLAAIIDWQNAHEGCAAEDLARLICSSLSGKIRRSCWETLLQKYYMLLRQKLTSEPPFTIEQLRESFMRILPFQMTLMIPTLGLPTQAEMQKNPEKREQIRQDAVEKALALFEDIFKYHELNKNANK